MALIQNPDLVTAIIAGGKSSRFSKSKSQEYLNGKRLIEYAIALAEKISEEKILITNEDQYFSNKIFPVLSDIVSNCGPVGGIYTALVQINKGWIATIPCDLPFLIPEVYKVLWRYRHSKKPTVAVVDQKIESLVALWPFCLKTNVNRYIMSGNFKINQILANLNSIEVDMQNELEHFGKTYFFNINFPHDLKNAEKLFLKQRY